MYANPAHPYEPWIHPGDRYYYGWYDEGWDGPDKRTDGEIKSIVVDRLRTNPYTKEYDIRVDVKRSVVILTGDVGSARAKRAAGDDAWDTQGVADVSNQLSVTTGS